MSDFIQVPPDSTGKRVLTHKYASGSSEFQVQVVHIGSHVDPEVIQLIDALGASHTRFTEGSPIMDAYSNLKTTQNNVLGVYEHSNSSYDDLFSIQTGVSGSSNYDPSKSSTVLSVTDDSGSLCMRTTNRYHYYQPGNSLLVLMTVCCGDSGKDNNVRRWGYYDDFDGFFFELSGSILNVVRRSSITGATIDVRVSQSAWSDDRLNGAGSSFVQLDVTKFNIYWIDVAWLGAGMVRVGVFDPSTGSRIVCHRFENGGSVPYPYMTKASLPFRTENRNHDITSGISELREGAAVILCEGNATYTFWRYADISCSNKQVTESTPLFSFRSAQTLSSGVTNHVNTYPERISVCAMGGPVKILLAQHDNIDLSGSNWKRTASSSSLEFDNESVSIDTMSETFWPEMSFYAPEGVTNFDLTPQFELNDEGVLLDADSVSTWPWTFIATAITGSNVSVAAELNYREMY